MATVGDIAVSAFVNVLLVFLFLAAFALLRIQPINDRVYFPKLYLAAKRRNRGSEERNWLRKHFSLNVLSWTRAFLSWMPEALKKSESSLIRDAGLDSVVFLRIYILGWGYLFSRTFFYLLFDNCQNSCLLVSVFQLWGI